MKNLHLIGQIAFGKEGIPKAHEDQVKSLVNSILDYLQGTIDIINFWSNVPEVSKLKGSLSDLMLLSGMNEIEDSADRLVTEIAALAKVRHTDIEK